jgi:surface polysaccharide O-acyltransferase-like enzyme
MKVINIKSYRRNLKGTKSQRIEYVDALKGFAIFCVVWGHSLQYLKNEYDFYHNPILAIYLLQRLIREFGMNRLIDFPNINIWIYNLTVTPLIALSVLAICMEIIRFTSRYKYINGVLFGIRNY